jgi:regulator of protease activity HflC (stomatin/prohibitin superfamily)
MYRIKAFDRIRNLPRAALPRDFRLNPLALLILVVFLGAGVIWQVTVGLAASPIELAYITVEVIFCAVLLLLLPSWALVLVLLVGLWIGMFARFDNAMFPLTVMISGGYLFAPVFQLAHHWEKAVILRLGKYHRLRGPGIFLIFPVIDRVTSFVDTRIRATDFSAEKTITMDTVPVHVDALAFWMIWDATKAILEVENFLEAVVLSAQTALRDAIGRHDLADLLAERERIGKEIQEVLDRKTNPWGITILSIEFTDIVIPKELEDAMSKRAQAERERQSRVILGTAEIEISDKFVEAAKRYKDDPTALHLRGMNMIYEGIKQRGTIVLLPSGSLSSMSLGSVLDDLAKGRLPGGQGGTPGQSGGYAGTPEGAQPRAGAQPAPNPEATSENQGEQI